MSEICTTCGAEKRVRRDIENAFCNDCSDVEDFVHEGGANLHFYHFSAWLERVIDRRVQKALAERELP